jgi:hypothetical protein
MQQQKWEAHNSLASRHISFWSIYNNIYFQVTREYKKSTTRHTWLIASVMVSCRFKSVNCLACNCRYIRRNERLSIRICLFRRVHTTYIRRIYDVHTTYNCSPKSETNKCAETKVQEIALSVSLCLTQILHINTAKDISCSLLVSAGTAT